jgi:hypothetical protein
MHVRLVRCKYTSIPERLGDTSGADGADPARPSGDTAEAGDRAQAEAAVPYSALIDAMGSQWQEEDRDRDEGGCARVGEPLLKHPGAPWLALAWLCGCDEGCYWMDAWAGSRNARCCIPANLPAQQRAMPQLPRLVCAYPVTWLLPWPGCILTSLA